VGMIDRKPFDSPQLARAARPGWPRGLLCAIILPLSNISPPQTPKGSARSTAPARHGSRSGHAWHDALASSRSAGCSENHSAALSLQGSGLPSSPARLASAASEMLVMSLHPREADHRISPLKNPDISVCTSAAPL